MYNDHLQLKNNKKPIKYIKIKKLKKILTFRGLSSSRELF